MLWVIGIVVVFTVAFILIKFMLNTNENPDSNLGILEHPSTFKKPDIEHVDFSISNKEE